MLPHPSFTRNQHWIHLNKNFATDLLSQLFLYATWIPQPFFTLVCFFNNLAFFKQIPQINLCCFSMLQRVEFRVDTNFSLLQEKIKMTFYLVYCISWCNTLIKHTFFELPMIYQHLLLGIIEESIYTEIKHSKQPLYSTVVKALHVMWFKHQ